MAIIHEGRILLEGEPAGAIDELRGRVWRRVITAPELERLERERTVISTRLLAGRTVAHVVADESPGAGFEAVRPELKDVYFSAMAGVRPPPHAP